MVSALILGVGLIAAGPGPVDLATYEAAKAKVGRDPDAHVKLALWCEAHGLQAERIKHLAIAVLSDPNNAAARGLMGLVAYRGRWERPESVGSKVKADPVLSEALAEYNARRARMPHTADAHWKLALWCEEKGLKAEEQAHLSTVVRLDPGRAAAWKRLGCRKVGNRWLSEAQIEAEKAEASAQKKADRSWKPILMKHREALAAKDKERRARAEVALNQVTDPRAVPSVFAVFAEGDERSQVIAVKLLGQIDGMQASRALAVLAVLSPSAEVRRMATETLRQRDIRDVVGWLIALIRKPLKYEVRPVGGPGSPGALFVEGQAFNVQRLYAPPPMPSLPLFAGEDITYDQFGLPVVTRMFGMRAEVVGFAPTFASLQEQGRRMQHDPNLNRIPILQQDGGLRRRYGGFRIGEATIVPLAENVSIPIGQIALQYQAAAVSAEKQLECDVARVETFNDAVRSANGRVLGILNDLTGQSLGEDQRAWVSWWANEQGYAYNPKADPPKPTIVEDVPLATLPQGVPVTFSEVQSGPATTSLVRLGHSCFRKGTAIRTLTGPLSIESITVGDQLLVEDPESGALSYQPVLATFHNRPAALYRVELGDETVWATGIHRFWRAGIGWVMARDLKPGDALRTLDGTVRVAGVEEGPVEPVFNLEVAAGHSFLVGRRGVLVHDNSYVRPVTGPFDAAPNLADLGEAASKSLD